PGSRLGPYEILSALGAGGMGEVYKARDTKLNRDVALKILPSEFALDTDRLARFKREAQVLASLDTRTSAPSTASKTQRAYMRSCCSWWRDQPSPTASRKGRSLERGHCGDIFGQWPYQVWFLSGVLSVLAWITVLIGRRRQS